MAWGLMAAVYVPMLRWYGVEQILGVTAPGVGSVVHVDDGMDSWWRSQEGAGWGVEGEDLLRGRPGMKQREG